MRLTERDYLVMRLLTNFNFLLGRQIKILFFDGTRACDRRLKILYENKFLNKKKLLVGIPHLYFLSEGGIKALGIKKRPNKIRVDRIVHDIAVIDTLIYIHKLRNIPCNSFISEKQLHGIDGFKVRKHHPDFIFTFNKNKIAIEIELTLKAKDRLLKNIEDNFMNYDKQLWIIPDTEYQIKKILDENKNKYTNIFTKSLEEVQNYVRNIK